MPRWTNTPVHEDRVVFLLSAKCGCSSVKRAVQAKQGGTGNPHVTLERWTADQVAASRYLRIAICRNPYARAVSCWWEKCHHRGDRNGSFRANTRIPAGIGFLEFLRAVSDMDEERDIHIRPQWRSMYRGSEYLPQHTFRLEDPAMWSKVQQLVAMPALPRANVSDAPDWRAICRGKVARLIEARWARDFEVFGYEMLRDR